MKYMQYPSCFGAPEDYWEWKPKLNAALEAQIKTIMDCIEKGDYLEGFEDEEEALDETVKLLKTRLEKWKEINHFCAPEDYCIFTGEVLSFIESLYPSPEPYYPEYPEDF